MITGYIKGQNLELRSPLVVADTINYMTAQFVFQTKDWDGCRKFSHWTCGDASFTIPLVHDRIEEDAHLNLTAGTWTVWIHGERYENGVLIQRITTDEAILTVKPTGSAGEGPFPEIPATEVERINAEMDELRESIGSGGGGGADLTEVNKRIDGLSETKVDKQQGAKNAGKLLYVGADGVVTVLSLGNGLKIENGVLMITNAAVTEAICGRAICGEIICGGV